MTRGNYQEDKILISKNDLSVIGKKIGNYRLKFEKKRKEVPTVLIPRLFEFLAFFVFLNSMW